MGIATVFNFLGPLTNPARPAAAAIGVADARMAPVVAEVLAARDVRALVFRGDDGLDRKSTRLNSSHANISYAVFCLKKKQRKAPASSCPRGGCSDAGLYQR